MSESPDRPTDDQRRAWEAHEREQRARLARLTLEEKLQWLEEAQAVVEQLARSREKSGGGPA